MEFLPLYLFAAICCFLMFGFPVAFTLAGTALAFAGFAITQGSLDPGFILALPERLFGTMTNITLMAVPLFVLMGVLLEKSHIAEKLLSNMALLMRGVPGGLGISVVIVGMLLAASTGIVGATVVTMGLISLPSMLKNNYPTPLATGIICSTGTLGQIIPPSIALVLLADVLSTAYHQAQIRMGIFSPKTVSVGDLFVGALIPGLLLVALYCSYILLYHYFNKVKFNKITIEKDSSPQQNNWLLLKDLLAPIGLILVVLGSILSGAATPTEAAGVGALGALLLAMATHSINITILNEVLLATLKVTSMVFMILIGAAVFSLVFRGLGGDELVQSIFQQLPGGKITAILVVMVIIFLLGFILDFIEITFVVVPIVGPILLMMGIDPVWLGIMIAVNLQTSFLTPPFGFALFYLRGVAPASVKTEDIYRGVIPFIGLQLLLLLLMVLFPSIVTALPEYVFAK